MASITIEQIDERLRQLPTDKLSLVHGFILRLLDRQPRAEEPSPALASELVLRRDWDRPEEDAAWADL